MKPPLAWPQIGLRWILATLLGAGFLSCAGDGATPLGAWQQAFTRETTPRLPRPFDLPEEPIVRGAEAGYLPGSGHVTPDGAYTYTLPIDVPPGRGIQPELALSYSSRRAGNGHLGVGFSLRGPSLIVRCPRSSTRSWPT